MESTACSVNEVPAPRGVSVKYPSLTVGVISGSLENTWNAGVPPRMT